MDKFKKRPEAEAETSPGVLLSSGYIAGGTIASVLTILSSSGPSSTRDAGGRQGTARGMEGEVWTSVVMFGLLMVLLLLIGTELIFKAPAEANAVPKKD